MSMRALTPDKIKKLGMKALTRELGVTGMIQFMQQFSAGSGDYSRDRHSLLDNLSVDDIWVEMKNSRKTGD